MDFFEYFGVKRSFQPQLGVVKRVYLEKSRELHPDLNTHVQESENLEEMTAFNNEAYYTLSKEPSLFNYLLGLHGILLGDLNLSPEFLGEMMDLNEEIAEIRLEQDQQAIDKMTQAIEQKKEMLRQELQPVLDAYDAGDMVGSLPKIAQYCLKSNYLRRLTNNLAGQIEL
ncbi:MAG: hypothetical protein KA340_01280 [Saprospiraceae bacterium]|nr:hypothetical protein [Saprospiraceae bacterium]